MALLNEVAQFRKEHQGVGCVVLSPASAGSCVAGGTIWVGLNKQGIFITVHLYVHHMQQVSAGLALGPQALSAAAPEGYQSAFNGLVVCFLVHVTQHQYLLGAGVLYDGGYKPV